MVDVAGRQQSLTGGAVSRTGAWSQYRRSRLQWLPDLVSLVVRVSDVVILMVTATIAHWIYLNGLSEDQENLYVVLLACACLLLANVFHFAGIYQFKRLASFWDQAARSLLALAILFLLVLAILYLTKFSAETSRGWMIIWFSLSAVGVIAARGVLWFAMRGMGARGVLARRVAIVGSGRPADRLATYLSHFPNADVTFAGIFDDRSAPREGTNVRRPDGRIDELCRLARTEQIDAIILAMPQVSEQRLSLILEKLRPLPVDIRLCRDTLEFAVPQSSYEFCGIVPLLRLYDRPVSGWGMLGKEIEDRVLAALALVVLSPVLLGLAIAIKMDSAGPVLFKQKRYGFNNRLITVWKFRTMYTHMSDANAEKLATRDDPRITRIGSFLRKSSLDELPQLFNVLFGDMSLVGPRPHAISAKAAGRLYEDVVGEYAARHRVKPGITGWAQVNGWRGETDTVEKISERVKHDLWYIDNWSIWLDIKILFMTVAAVLKRENAF